MHTFDTPEPVNLKVELLAGTDRRHWPATPTTTTVELEPSARDAATPRS